MCDHTQQRWQDIIALVTCALLSFSVITSAQAPPRSTEYHSPRTSAGHPDISGVWTNTTITRLERPGDLANKAFFSEEEANTLEQDSANRRTRLDAPSAVRTTPLPKGGRIGSYNAFWYSAQDSIVSTRRTSLVIDPPDGRIPTRPSAEARAQWLIAHRSDGFKNMSPYSRCITRGIPGSMLPNVYNTGNHILQTPDYIVMRHEMMGFRMIPLDNRPRVSDKINQWMGDARGWWEEDTLVVETHGFTDKGWITPNGNAGRMHGVPVTEKLRVVERFTRIGEHQLDWHVTIHDPDVYTAPWAVQLPLTREPDYVLYEYACHEGNHAVLGVLGGARVAEQTVLSQ